MKKEEWVKALMHDLAAVEGIDQPDGSKHNVRATLEYFYDLATNSIPLKKHL